MTMTALAAVVVACSGNDDETTSSEARELAPATTVEATATATTSPPETTEATETTEARKTTTTKQPTTTERETTTTERSTTTTAPQVPTTTTTTTTTTIPSYPLDRATVTANAYRQSIDVSTCSFPPSITAAITVECPIEKPDGSAGTWTVTVDIDQSVTGSYVETRAAPVFVDIDNRTWELIARDPDAHVGELIRVYGYVTQADSATGIDTIRANVDGEQHGDWYDYNVNTLLSDVTLPNDLVNVVQGDLFVAEVTVIGSFSYDTQIGGSTTVPLLSLHSIAVTGHEDF
jgi:hypothetical protein